MKRVFILILLTLVQGMTFPLDKTLYLVTLDYPPFIYLENGQATGEIAETVKEVFKRLNIHTKIDFFPAARGVSMVTSGAADAMFSLKKTNEREATMLFPEEPLILQDFVFF